MKQLCDIFESIFSQAELETSDLIANMEDFRKGWIDHMDIAGLNSEPKYKFHDDVFSIVTQAKNPVKTYMHIDDKAVRLPDILQIIKLNVDCTFQYFGKEASDKTIAPEIEAYNPTFRSRVVKNLEVTAEPVQQGKDYIAVDAEEIRIENCSFNTTNVLIHTPVRPVIDKLYIPQTKFLEIIVFTDIDRNNMEDVLEYPKDENVLNRNHNPAKLRPSDRKMSFYTTGFTRNKLFIKDGEPEFILKYNKLDDFLNGMDIDIRNYNQLEDIHIRFNMQKVCLHFHRNGSGRNLVYSKEPVNGWNVYWESIR